jgi:hypothetical protein
VKYGIEIGSGVTIYIPSFIKIGSGIQKLMGRGNSQTRRYIGTQTYRQHGDPVSLL